MHRIALHSLTPPLSTWGGGSLGLFTGTNQGVEEVQLGQAVPLTNQSAWGKVSLKSLEITNDSRVVSYQLSAVS